MAEKTAKISWSEREPGSLTMLTRLAATVATPGELSSLLWMILRWPTSDNLHANQLTLHQHHNRLKLVRCGCGVGVVRAGLGEGCHLWATV